MQYGVLTVRLNMKRISRLYPAITAFICAVAADIVTKAIISAKMVMYQTVPVAGDVVRLTYLKNSGMAFGMFHGFPHAMLIVTLLAVVLICVKFRSLGDQTAVVKAAYGMILGGAAGNIIDRLRFGAVRDFIDVGINSRYRWHNPADFFVQGKKQ